jgi:hypothetical protein
MKLTRTLDTLLSITTVLSLVVLVVVMGDALYLGLWYYIAVPVVLLGTVSVLKPAPLFLFGTTAAMAASMIVVMSVNWHAAHPEGLLGLAHLFSLPGAFVVVWGTAFAMRKKRTFDNPAYFLMGLGSFGIGYFINQLVLCNTYVWCGPLSFPIR